MCLNLKLGEPTVSSWQVIREEFQYKIHISLLTGHRFPYK
jgi:hypothetical protein